jgi:copper oxidase (laccase) domain-containing protein
LGVLKVYEVGPEFIEYFDEQFLTPHGEKYLLDMVAVLQDKLHKL